MRFSLIVATFGRSIELKQLLTSLVGQTYSNFEVIIIDQNADNRVERVIEPFIERLDILHRVTEPGLSRARNLGLSEAKGDVIAFPDDDCWYPKDALERVADFLKVHGHWDGIIGHSVDASGKATLPWHDDAGRLTPAMSWRRAVTYCYFLRCGVVAAVRYFDESLGPGAGTPWGAGEDNDFLLRAIKTGARIYFDPTLSVHHPHMFLAFDGFTIEKRARYARGDGRVLRKHPMPWWWALAFFLMPLARLLIAIPSFDRAQLRFHWVTFIGRTQGFLGTTRS